MTRTPETVSERALRARAGSLREHLTGSKRLEWAEWALADIHGLLPWDAGAWARQPLIQVLRHIESKGRMPLGSGRGRAGNSLPPPQAMPPQVRAILAETGDPLLPIDDLYAASLLVLKDPAATLRREARGVDREAWCRNARLGPERLRGSVSGPRPQQGGRP